MQNRNIAQISVLGAAEKLGVSERSVLNYIKMKEIEAIKVGKQWFVSVPSLDAFAQRYGHKPIPLEEIFPVPSNETTPSPSTTGKKELCVLRLRCFELMTQAFAMPGWMAIEDITLQKRVIDLRLQAIELVSAGYYTFSFEMKRSYYNQSRARVGSILGLIYSQNSLQTKLKSEIDFLEQIVLTAFASLIKKLERDSSHGRTKNLC